LLRLLGGRRAPGSNRPDRLIRDDRLLDLLAGEARETPADLGADDLLGDSALALLERLAHAHDGLQRRGVGRRRLPGNEGVVLLLVLTALRMPEDHVADGEFLEHLRGN